MRLDSLHYNNAGYSHQAWFTDDHRYILLNDELDEDGVTPTRTYIFDALDLDNLVLAGGNGYFRHATPALDPHLYVRANFVFQSNYSSGLRILALTDLAQAQLTEVGYFDLFPANNDAEFSGTWNNYPFFASGNIPASHMEQGLFILHPTNLCTAPAAPGPRHTQPRCGARQPLQGLQIRKGGFHGEIVGSRPVGAPRLVAYSRIGQRPCRPEKLQTVCGTSP